jgi:hypothetical protein
MRRSLRHLWRVASRARYNSATFWPPRPRSVSSAAFSLEDALGYLDLLAELKPEKLERAAVRWHGRLETEATFLSLGESQLALAALASLCAGERDAVEVLRRLLRRVRPTVVPRVSA